MMKVLNQLAETPWAKIVVFGLILCVVYYFGLRDDGKLLAANLESEKQSLTEASAQLQTTRKAMENAARFETQILAAKAQFEKVNEFMPPKLSVADLTTLISDKSLRSNVRLLSTAPKYADATTSTSTTPKSPYYDSIRVSFKIEGTFAQILAFLSQISRDPRMVMFENSDMTVSPGSAADNPTLVYGGELVGYRFKDDKKASATPTSAAPAAAAGDANAKP